ncbi:MAG: signal peptidase II [Clostridium sp.]|nr:signal peptidase II [Acetatifactor muris]MCM1526515.1 signal peptidase II [Bacteroides sp.]MCM1562359.1 signal peptidase II [Clostridium sp.]
MRRSRHQETETVNKKKILAMDVLIVAALLALDQFTKYLAIDRLKGNPPYVLWDGVLELQYLENHGSAFGMLQNQKFFILFVGVFFMLVILYFLIRLPGTRRYNRVHLLLSVVIAGGVGNMIDRFRFDYVVDFISFVLIRYPIFNVADIYIVVGVICLFALFMFVFQEKDLEFLSFKQKRYREMK